MIKNLIVLPDGTEIYSGNPRGSAIISCNYTECVNSGTELTLGSVCCNELELKLYTPGGRPTIAAGDEIQYYTVNETGTREKVGLFTVEQPTRMGSGTMKFTAYDRISWLDKDLTDWLATLEAWPYAVSEFAEMVATACGVTLEAADIINGDYKIQEFSGSGITGRQLMQWVGEICGRFCRATTEGTISFDWYTDKGASVAPNKNTLIGARYDAAAGELVLDLSNADIVAGEDGTVEVVSDDLLASVGPDGELVLTSTREVTPYFGGGLTYEDYETSQIDKVQIQLTEDDVGTVYPPGQTEGNTYKITGNYLLTTTDADALVPVAENLFSVLSQVKYTPGRVRVQAGSIRAGDIITVQDANGVKITMYVMQRIRKGQCDTLECTGSSSRDTSTVVNQLTLGALNAKMLELRKTIEGLSVSAKSLETTIDGEIKEIKENITSITVTADGLKSKVSAQEGTLDDTTTRLTNVEQTADSVTITVADIVENGAGKVETTKGYTFGDDGLTISSSDSGIINTLDETGMKVSSSGTTMLEATADGVVATDVTVNNYLIVGANARFEDFARGTDTKRTACFWVGG